MKRRKFVKSIGVLAVGCMSAIGLSWEPHEKHKLKPARTGVEWIIHPDSILEYRVLDVPFRTGLAMVCSDDSMDTIIDYFALNEPKA